MTREAHRSDIAACLLSAGVPDDKVVLGDEYYALPTERWVKTQFAREWEAITRMMGIRYRDEQQDCEDFSLMAAGWAKHFHAETPGAPSSGLAFGELWIGSLDHGMNLVIHQNDQGDLYCVAYEPQIGARGWAFNLIPLSFEDYRTALIAKL